MTSSLMSQWEAIHPDRTVRLPMFTNEDLSTIVLSVDEVQEVLQGLHPNKAPGPDGIPNRLLKEAAPVISTSLCNLFNLSLSTSQLPAEWKQCNVTPVYKKGDRSNPSNYRPIALLPTVPKVLERLVHNRLYTYLMNNNLININQSGFKKGDGTVPQLMRLVDEWAKSIDDPSISCTAAVFLDVRRAFDTVWHDGLVYKLSR
ncbi:Hypp9263 [Branchiostoma lanceolatum]|uniref:Hypp9263 protein n=1 Tax=Branchiostoma lanceolatum TaxID=7740 RepID=A0A8J9ZD49_BRALA|nr:Hypp9263 [Branchiostoma lanceolatum]